MAEPPEYDQRLAQADIKAIKATIRSLSGVDHRLVFVRVDANEVVTVLTGTSHYGNEVKLLREGDGWRVTSVSKWMS